MKRYPHLFTLALLLSGLFLFSRCSEEDTVVTIPIPDVNACIPAGTKDYWEWTTISRDEVDSLFAAYGITYNPDDVESVQLDSAVITLTSPTGANFNEIIVFDLWFREAGATGNGTKVAYLTNIASNSATVKMESQFSELQAFLAMDSFEAGLHINRDPAAATLCVSGSVTLKVTVSGE